MPTARAMPLYQCHKKVWALKIREVYQDEDGWFLGPEEAGYGSISVEDSWVKKHDPHPGGYYVQYRDGYESFSPAEAFEDGYKLVQ